MKKTIILKMDLEDVNALTKAIGFGAQDLSPKERKIVEKFYKELIKKAPKK